MKRRAPELLAGILILLVSPPLRAQPQEQTAANASKIGAITVAGTQKLPADQIIPASGIKVGDVVTVDQIQAAADRLAALGIFSSVNFHYSSTGDSIALNFDVKEAPTFPLSFDNFPWFTDGELAEAIRREVGLFTGEAPESGTMIDAITLALETLLASRNIKGNVTHQLIAQAVSDGMMMQFRVEGPGLKVQSVRFGDSLATESQTLKDRITDIKGQPYSHFAVEVFENEHVMPLYASKGFLRAQFGPLQSNLTTDANHPEGTGVDVLIPVMPGPAYSWKGASWQGNTVFASAVLDGAFGLKPGDLANGLKIEGEWQRIESEYKRHGYLDVKLNPQPQYDEAGRQVSYHVDIVEGPQYHMGEMVITGLSLDAEARLRHVWLISRGEVFDNGYYETIANELAKPTPTIFGEMPIHYTQFGHFLRPNSNLHTVDVLMDFK